MADVLSPMLMGQNDLIIIARNRSISECLLTDI